MLLSLFRIFLSSIACFCKLLRNATRNIFALKNTLEILESIALFNWLKALFSVVIKLVLCTSFIIFDSVAFVIHVMNLAHVLRAIFWMIVVNAVPYFDVAFSFSTNSFLSKNTIIFIHLLDFLWKIRLRMLTKSALDS